MKWKKKHNELKSTKNKLGKQNKQFWEKIKKIVNKIKQKIVTK